MMTSRNIPNPATARRAVPSGFSSLLLLAITVQISLAMLEWAGPGSADTRTRLATTMVAAAHQGVFTEPRTQVQAFAPASVRPDIAPSRHASVRPAAAAIVHLPRWISAIPPPGC